MEITSATQFRPGVAFGLAGAVAGLGLAGVDAVALWAVVGYFVGKSLESVLLAASGVRPT